MSSASNPASAASGLKARTVVNAWVIQQAGIYDADFVILRTPFTWPLLFPLVFSSPWPPRIQAFLLEASDKQRLIHNLFYTCITGKGAFYKTPQRPLKHKRLSGSEMIIQNFKYQYRDHRVVGY